MANPFDTSSDPGTFSSQYDSGIDSTINSLENGNLGAQGAASAAGAEGRSANLEFEQMQNNPSFTGNAAVLGSMNNQVQETYQRGASSAYLAGAKQDAQSKLQGAELGEKQQSLQYAEFRRKQDLARRPSFWQQLLMGVVGGGVGALTGGVSTLVGGAASAASNSLFGAKPAPSDGGGTTTPDPTGGGNTQYSGGANPFDYDPSAP